MPATFFGSADIPALLAEFGQNVVIGAVLANGIVDRPGQQQLSVDQAPVAIENVAVIVTVQTGTYPALAVGANVTIIGDAVYVATSVLPFEDGALTQVYCAAR